MGASVWQREGAAGDGKTFTSGVIAGPTHNAQRPGKRKLIWKREDSQGNGSSSQPAPAGLHEAENGSKRPRWAAASQPNGQAHAETSCGQASQAHPAAAPSGSSSTGPGRPAGAAHHHSTGIGSRNGSSWQHGHATVTWVPVTPAAAAANRHQSSAQNAVEELKRLKEKIAAREAQARKEQAAAKARAEAEKCQKEDMSRRRSRLQASMAEAFREARDAMADAETKQAPGGTTAGDDKEVARVLRARDDCEVLRLSPGCTLTALKKRYREMAVILHPDKCLAARATDAFQRLMTAYQNILKLLA